MRVNNRYLMIFAVVQVLLLAGVLVYYGTRQDACKTMLEAHAPESVHHFALNEHDLLNTVSFFYGTEECGIDLPTEARKNLIFSSGQMIWILLKRPTSDSLGQATSQKGIYPASLWHPDLPATCRDGVVNFLYDVGSDTSLSYANWCGTAVPELQASPLLPWQKHLDFVVLSSLEDPNAGGLPFVTNLNANTLIVAPPLDVDRLTRLGHYEDQPNLLQLPEGITRLLPGLWALVLPTPERFASAYELDLLLERSDGTVALIVGSALNPPLAHLRAAARLGKPISWYAGSTGWSTDTDMLNVETELNAIAAEFPDLDWQPAYNTSAFVAEYMQEALGERYHTGCLGSIMHCE